MARFVASGFVSLLLCMLLAVSPAVPQAGGIEWDTLNQEVLSLIRQGRYASAVIVAKTALRIAEEEAGQDHPDVATSLNNLAAIYVKQGLYAQAEPLYRRSLAISEQAQGPDHPDVASSLNNLAFL